jgi:hypothetical protein
MTRTTRDAMEGSGATDPGLDQLLSRAAAAPPNTRIELRDDIAAFGARAIEAVQPWLADRALCRFAVRVICRVGEQQDRQRATAVLRDALGDPSVAADREDLAFHLRRLGYVASVSQRAPRGTAGRLPSIPLRAGTAWPGFQEREFRTTDGTHWRAKDGDAALTPLLLRPLRALHRDFDSFSIYHSPEIHLALRSRYTIPNDGAQGWRASKLVAYAHGYTPDHPDALHEVVVGWYIEHGDGAGAAGAMDDRWDWPYLLRALDDPGFRSNLLATMERHDLRLGDYRGGRFWPGATTATFVASVEDGGLVVRDGDHATRVVGSGIDDLVRQLCDVPPDTWRDIHLWRAWSAREAMAASGAFARESMLPVLEDLARLYLRVVPGAR